jgi:hypothetical protein
MGFANLIDQIIGTINGMSLKDLTPPASDDPIHEYFGEKLGGLFAQAATYYGWLSADSGAAVTVDSYALTVQNSKLLVFGGHFDEIDLRFFGALASLIDGLYEFISAYDMRFDYSVLQIPTGGAGNTLATIDKIATLLDALLTSKTYPTFLALLPPDGAGDLASAGLDFGDAFARLTEMFAGLQAARDRGPAQIGWANAVPGERWDPATEPLLIGQTATLSPAVTVAVMPLVDKLRRAFYQGSPKDVDPAVVDVLTPADLTDLLTALGVLPLKIGSLTLSELPAWPAIDIGAFFSEPQPDQLRQILETVVELWEFIEPLIGAGAAEGLDP